MNLRIEEIQYENIREFKDLEIDFTKANQNDVHHISLVQMPNGTGKTTTMQLIRQLILGVELPEAEVYDYEPDFDASEGEFMIGFRSGSDRFRVHMHLDYDVGTVHYTHSYPQREGGGKNNGHFMPMELDSALTENFVDLFVFNGELTDEFIETSENKAEAALKIVNRLDRIEGQRDLVETVVEKRRGESEEDTETEQGLKMARTNLRKRENKLTELNKKRDSLQSAIEDHDKKIKEKKKKRDDIIAKEGDKLDEYKEYESEIQNLRSELNTSSAEILDDMRRPSKLSNEMRDNFVDLLDHMTVLQLPKSTSQEFFTELAESKQCLCGREITESEREAILSNADDYLSDEDIGVLNTLKEQLRNTAEPIDFESKLQDLADTRKKLKQTEMKQQQLDLDDPELEQKKQDLTEEIENERNARDNKKRKIEYLTTDDKGEREAKNLNWKKNIPAAKREVTKYKNKVEEATGTVKFSKQADKLEDILNDFVLKCLYSLKEEQIENTNERLSEILKLSEVQIESIDESIKLKNQSGSSEGQSLAVAYAYLSTLFENSEVDMPFVIDSPAVSLDHKVRREVASTISGLFDQLIAFIISTEKEGFVDNLQTKEVNGAEDIQYYTIYKTNTPGVVDQHTDRELFMEFTSEEDGTNTANGSSD
jgi:DNA repair exonuclease SbcCD ATPase subunit